MKRSQLNTQRWTVLVELLKSHGIISDAEGKTLLEADAERLNESERMFREGRGPPEWTADKRGGGDGL